MSETYIVGYDETDTAQRVLDNAIRQAKQSGAALHLILVLEWSPYSFHTPEELAERHRTRESELERAREILKPAIERLNSEGIAHEAEVKHGNARDILAEAASRVGASQIIIGRKGGASVADRLLGSIAFTLAQSAPVPVTIIP